MWERSGGMAVVASAASRAGLGDRVAHRTARGGLAEPWRGGAGVSTRSSVEPGRGSPPSPALRAAAAAPAAVAPPSPPRFLLLLPFVMNMAPFMSFRVILVIV